MSTQREGVSDRSSRRIGQRELIGVCAVTMMMGALAIDTVLPLFPDIRLFLDLATDSNKTALLVTMYMFGLGSGQMLIGMLSDRFGRRPVLICTLTIYAVAAIATTFAPTFGLMVAARFVWGFGAGGPRVIANAMIRDTVEGVRMAQLSSYVQSIFVIVPVLAPSVATLFRDSFGWRVAMCFPALMASLLVVWIFRIPETLQSERRRAFDVGTTVAAARELRRFPSTILYALGMMCLMASMTSYIGTTEQIIDHTYGRAAQFPVIFGLIALVMGVSTLLNAKLVARFGLQRMVTVAPAVLFVHSSAFAIISLASSNKSPFPAYCVGMAGLLALQTLVLPNCNAAAMQPVGHLAGTASGVSGTVSTMGGAAISIFVTNLHTNGTNVLAVAQAALAGGCLLATIAARKLSAPGLSSGLLGAPVEVT